ncbi:hypothetical protein Q5424_09415 [Conexibacter sp. JD483]|uniref:hypothetical protein n=1 Tax=unclassified Conexibacter TaxID=2627773 RepID=UPI002720D2AC|nr:MULTISPECIES: hypothetical protein [unclassified Conexibacter]MDO8187205.1 hypothetical protein [Conexibacter sp. CPCC 205706]MDO8199302.1 hypothetical protein [Conexibacter sp. CPCC 205762]MDR9369297.1 hypothetical protein [Conexibacter sp. JD483]
MQFVRAFLDDLVRLKLPVTAGAVVTTVLALAQPFGLTLGGDATAKVTGALVAVGVISQYVQDRLLGGVVVKTNPATQSAPPAEVSE